MNMMTNKPVVETWDAMTARHHDEREAAILDLAASGLTVSQAAEALGTSLNTVTGYIFRYKVPASFTRQKRAKVADTGILDQRIRMSTMGYTLAKAAKALGIRCDHLARYSRRHGITWGKEFK